MYSNFKAQAIEYVKQAVQEDKVGNYEKAFPLYMNALEYFKAHLKYEKDPKIKEAIMHKFGEYLRRTEEIRVVLDKGGSGLGLNGGDADAATRPNDEEDGDDPEQSKLRSALDCEIIRNFKQKAIEYVKEAVQEDNAKAFPLYMNALGYFKTYLKYENNPKIKMAIIPKFNEYLNRAEEIRAVLDEDSGGPGPSGGNAIVTTRPKMKPEDGVDGEDPK
ncbi:PREDICTED: protein SUPPRESSOR OF K(+) TRANSPORT GROWTH DEFECT 1-like [Nicotiana attenuata]|uniref:Protein suppressor of k(+) transport growth defect 1 n=1 Tax=Nicotiana attenuata TaxID=49451 RepID=A0A1J6IMN5_NICAT|nr:PREDICTED: protein SUPPRESSOR OF K(+) TRANSPORT GROWTH DEFECT 1-like [Nicotiana attenuata]OIT06421.1 protein suppressor of k(+) transport growth defect 1 [Nicotiana attenuata]